MASPPTGVLFYEPRAKPLSKVGFIQPGAYYQFYLTGTLTPATVYSDGGLTVPLSQTPGTGGTTAASDGRLVPIYLNPAITYRVQLYSAFNQLLEDVDPYIPAPSPSAGQIGAILYPQTTAEAGLSITPTSFQYPSGNVLRYGADPLGVSDSAPAFSSAILVGSAGKVAVVIPGGTYSLGSLINFGVSSLQVRADGIVFLKPTSAGQGVSVDGGAVGSGVNGVSITGFIKVIGNPSTTDAWFVRATHRSWLEMRAGDCATGLRAQWCVDTTFKFICSSNEAPFTVQVPQAGMILELRGTGEQVAGCTFIDATLEGILAGNGYGILLNHTFMNTYIGGTSEGNKVGIRQEAQSPHQDNYGNTFVGMDFESNANNDIVVVGGGALTLIGINSNSPAVIGPNIDLQGGDNTTFMGGFLRQVNVSTSSTGTLLQGCQLASGVGITGTGPYKLISCQSVDGFHVPTTPTVFDQIGTTINTFLPTVTGGTTPGSQTYSTQKCSYTQVGTAGNGWVDFAITLTLTANSGGTGNAQITLPVNARNIASQFQTVVIGDYTGVTLGAAGRTLALRLNPGVATGLLVETDTGSVNNILAIGSVGATAQIIISGRYLI